MFFRFRKKFQLLLLLATVLVFYYFSFFLFVNNDVNKEGNAAVNNPSSSARHTPRDIHVVIGYYQGNDLPWIKSGGNLSEDLLNANMYSPDPSAGKDGEAVIIPSFESPKSSKLFQINRFNLMASDRIPLNRSLPDVRRNSCRGKEYGDDLGRTSIVIVFHNEAWSTLMRTVVSIVNRSPKGLIEEIILVDDASRRAFLSSPALENSLKHLEPTVIKILHSPSRIGLIRARLLGAQSATGSILTFLDAHCEVSEGWLEPLLQRVKLNRRTIASPVIDIINDDTFQYVRSFEMHQGAFNWELHFRWFSLPSEMVAARQDDPSLPFQTPVIAGGLFSIEKEFFYEIGSYDEKMEVWGGENLEISFRAWMCGGILEIVPCSHVGHLFRKSSPYSFPGGVGDTLNQNLARVALVWMDEWKEFFFKLHPEIATHRNKTSVTSRLELKKKLNCKSFAWYLENIWPNNFFPPLLTSSNGGDNFFGKIRSKLKRSKCLQTPVTKTFGQPYGDAQLSPCTIELYAPHLFVYRSSYIKTDDNVCLDAIKIDSYIVKIMACSLIPRQQWELLPSNGDFLIKHVLSGKCVKIEDKTERLLLGDCNVEDFSQIWIFEGVNWLS